MRCPLGNYPKWLGIFVCWFLRKRLPKHLKLQLRGRRPDWKAIEKTDYVPSRFGGLPLRYAKRVGIYVIEKDKRKNQDIITQ